MYVTYVLVCLCTVYSLFVIHRYEILYLLVVHTNSNSTYHLDIKKYFPDT